MMREMHVPNRKSWLGSVSNPPALHEKGNGLLEMKREAHSSRRFKLGGSMNRSFKLALLFSLGVLYSAPLPAHHGAAAFDTNKRLTLSGTVTEWFWANPHCFLKFDVKGENGEVVHWIAETSNPADMTNRGWSKQSFKPGDEVTVTVEPVKNGRPAASVLQAILPNGKILYATGKAPAAAAGAADKN